MNCSKSGWSEKMGYGEWRKKVVSGERVEGEDEQRVMSMNPRSHVVELRGHEQTNSSSLVIFHFFPGEGAAVGSPSA